MFKPNNHQMIILSNLLAEDISPTQSKHYHVIYMYIVFGLLPHVEKQHTNKNNHYNRNILFVVVACFVLVLATCGYLTPLGLQ